MMQKIRKRGMVVGGSLLLAGAIVATPMAAQAGTIVQSGGYSTQVKCWIAADSMRIQGYSTSTCEYTGDLFGWRFWYEKK